MTTEITIKCIQQVPGFRNSPLLVRLKKKKRNPLRKNCIRIYSGPYFPAFGLNADQNNREYGHFSRSK